MTATSRQTPRNASLKERLTRAIARDGPMPLAVYMHRCMNDPDFGYYTTRQAIGGSGDFITAPEVSQMFGELIGVWAISAWQQLGEPARFCIAEAGPGRGTLMADLLRVIATQPCMAAAAEIRLIEASPLMRAEQEARLRSTAARFAGLGWLDTVDRLPDMPLIFVANEFLDVLPFRQYVKSKAGWQEAGVGLDTDGGLQRVLLPALADPAILPHGAQDEPEGAVFEHAPAREALVAEIAARIKARSGAALFIDYGHAKSGFGDTFQAMGGHAYRDPFAEPGKADLTSHVDFERLVAAATQAGIESPSLKTQTGFLIAMGLIERAGALGAGKPAETQQRLRGEVERLAGPDGMGNLFKVLELASDGIDPTRNALPG